MAKPVSDIEIVNLALLQIHEAGVTTLSDTNNVVSTMGRNLVAPTRRATLGNYCIWNFAKKRTYISKDNNTAPAFDYESRYLLPNDFIRLVQVGTEEDQWDPQLYDIEGRYILTNDSDASIPIIYVRDVEEVNEWSPLFVDLVVLELAVRLCVPVTGDRLLKRDLVAERDGKIAEAAMVDHQERPVQVIEVDPIRDARMLGSEIPQLRVPSADW